MMKGMQLETTRLLLTPLRADDAEAMAVLGYVREAALPGFGSVAWQRPAVDQDLAVRGLPHPRDRFEKLTVGNRAEQEVGS